MDLPNLNILDENVLNELEGKLNFLEHELMFFIKDLEDDDTLNAILEQENRNGDMPLMSKEQFRVRLDPFPGFRYEYECIPVLLSFSFPRDS